MLYTIQTHTHTHPGLDGILRLKIVSQVESRVSFERNKNNKYKPIEVELTAIFQSTHGTETSMTVYIVHMSLICELAH